MKRFRFFYPCDIAFAIALLLKFFSAGIWYFPVLDDHIQYGSYPLFPLSHVLFNIGTVSSRPFASILDPSFWGLFYHHMWIALGLICVLYFFSAVLLDRILVKHHVTVTPFLYATYLLMPITFEGSYWISASSRIVVGMFFATAAAFLLMRYFSIKKKRILAGYIALALLSFGFYESVMIFSFVLQIFVIVKRALNDKTKKTLLYLVFPFALALLMMLYYVLAARVFSSGSRASTFSLNDFGERIRSLLEQFVYIITTGSFRTTINGFWDGLKHILSSPLTALILIPLILGVSALCAKTGKKYEIRGKVNTCVPLGLAMIGLPLLPHLLVPDVWLTYRSVLVCIPGFCVLFAPIGRQLLKKHRSRQFAIFLLVALFSVGCVNELQTYQKVSKTDAVIVENVANALSEDVKNGNASAILVLPHEIIIPQTSYYKDHVKSVASSDWALTGAVRAKTKNNGIPYITPVYSLDGVDTDGKQVLYMDKTYQVTEETYE